jgi:hypothetical protein
MSSTDFSLTERLMYQCVEEELRQAKLRQLQREAGATGRGWLFQRMSLALYPLGQLLASMGQRLKQASRTQIISPQEHADRKA